MGILGIWIKQTRSTKDTPIESPAKIPHRWINESDTVFRVLVVKVPKPTKETILL